ncbi:aminotransferase class V-fold PLP-dependent enzyme [Botrimarina mediterranea]|uniref:Putative cysteine desulfurase n=1 Tax=Botrimarina mediterranea TaxID=2528022 RepID=A0A518KAD7_9BACT|nr:aminotransferase class V-fold PLP-dependent enzyme [Botrimarina mediterranea]QDV74748.1 putative cysteine desulfurase [Botrimarina mediterranea]QDV79393.1 putative cysteine desulfurase [Planctomycetes bacterium K2D]
MPSAPADPAVTRQRLRSAMPVTNNWAYFDHAAVAPLSGPARDRLAAWAGEAAAEGDTNWLAWDRGVETTRRTAATLIGATPDEIALVPSTTAGINLVAEGLDWRDGDNVVVLADEFPSNLYPWMQQAWRGVETRTVSTDRGRIDFDQLRAACDSRTRIVSVSWVAYASGYRQPLDVVADIAHSAGALFFLDAIQATGVFPLDVSQTAIDFLAADGHKWMLGPEGAGFAYIRQEHLDKLRPLGVGWHSVKASGEFGRIALDLKDSAARYEGGSANMPGHLALGASLDLLTAQPTNDVAAAVLDVTDYLCERLASIGVAVASHRGIEQNGHDPRSGIVVADLTDPTAARQRLLDAGCVTSVRGGRLRMSPHGYTSYEDVDRLIDVLR